jgi:proteasome lid subunit RPN8/RPN11
VVGFYHSHPDHAAAASERDREGAWEGYVYVIVAVTGAGCGEMRGWRLGGDGAMREVEMGVA